MKTLKSIIIAFVLGTLFSNSANAQTPSCSYMVQNSNDCDVNVTVSYFSISNCSGPACTVSTTTIPSNQNFTFNCAACGNLCDVEVQINWIGNAMGNSFIPAAIVNVNNTSIIAGVISNGPCATSPSTYAMNWATGNCDITN